MKMNEQLERLLPEGSRVLCAVSGGADSVCLLSMLHEKRGELGISLFAAHYEHGIRGEESLRDMRFVAALCERLGVPCVTESGNVPLYAKEKGMSTEEAARELRYAFLEKAAENFGCDRIATAHNADDNAETVIFNLCRGSGTAGLRGIPAKRGKIVRPLLSMTRAEIEAWLEERDIEWVNDSSNDSDDYSRNLIRHKVSPVLKKINPGYTAAISSLSAIAGEDEDFISGLAQAFIAENFDGESLSQAALKAQHRAVSSRVVRALCPKSLGREHVESVLSLLEGTELKYLSLPGIKVRREQGRIYFSDKKAQKLGEYKIAPGEKLYISEAGLWISAEKTVFDGEINGLFKTYCIKCESICGDILIGSRKAGDSYRPRGRNCTKTLKSLFLEAKMNQQERELSPVFRDEKGILAVYPFAADERTRAEKGDEVIILKIERNTGDSRNEERY